MPRVSRLQLGHEEFSRLCKVKGEETTVPGDFATFREPTYFEAIE
jgi:hypothetical protein